MCRYVRTGPAPRTSFWRDILYVPSGEWIGITTGDPWAATGGF
jgi:hypothetical protein